ncbi:MAG: nucleoside-diphosphate kinase [Rhodospirillales bacterium]
MAVERTLSIIKPNATARDITGAINARLEEAGLRIIAQKRLRLSREQAKAFYAVHAERPFYDDLCDFMSSGPVVVQVLEGEDAIAKNREVMGATDPAEAQPGTIRAEFGENVERNAVHGSDRPATAESEIAFFFDDSEIAG